MNPSVNTLQRIGHHLDQGIYPTVHNGGFVRPLEGAISTSRGKVKRHEREREGRSKTKPWQRATRGQGPTDRPRSTNQATSLVRSTIQSQYQEELSVVQQAYPKTQAWHLSGGLLLLTESALIEGLNRSALFLIAIPYDHRKMVKSWGFWGSLSLPGPWIGPRHTNAPDGSICAFEPKDQTWQKGDSLVELLDLYSLWAVRHLHLECHQRWPGHQSVTFACERLLEVRSDEYCGCGKSNKLYRNCCQKEDLKIKKLAAAMSPEVRQLMSRKPPTKLCSFLHSYANPVEILALSGWA
jgi:hypothetical protein